MSLPSITRWLNRTALVTGASSGIGSSVCEAFVKHGIKVIGCARNEERIQALASSFTEKNYPGVLIPYKCDVSNDEEVEKMFEWIKTNHTGVDICVNNAGFSFNKPLLEISGKEMREMLDVNVVALTLCTSKSVESMKTRGINDGHIFNINSMSGHRITGFLNFYTATKFAVTAITEGFRRELVENSKIKITSISPGLVETEFLYRTFNNEKQAKDVYATVDVLTPNDIADILLFVLSGPTNVQIHDVLLRPVGQKT
ncbi:unnamed protein product [Orchesella dallaii]|uniref:Dehydrogenase/reductase SDR family member 11 n=1 Tax=Orchesella dallaii TaxID=48710 RepID=A0ABP1QMH6_9HEXA